MGADHTATPAQTKGESSWKLARAKSHSAWQQFSRFSSITIYYPITCPMEPLKILIIVLRDHLEQWSPAFLVPGTRFVEDDFSTDKQWGWAWGWFQDDSSTLHVLCTLYLLLLHQLHLRSSGIRSWRLRTLALENQTEYAALLPDQSHLVVWWTLAAHIAGPAYKTLLPVPPLLCVCLLPECPLYHPALML